jgi:Xaa-Pro aminopeptidase
MSRLRENRLRKVRDKFENLGIDTFWIIQPENRRYLSDFKASDGQLTESSGSLFISLDQAILLTDPRYTTQAHQEVKGFEVITQREGFIEALCEILERLHVKKLGFESSYLIWNRYQEVQKKFAQKSMSVELVPLSNVAEEMREIKEPEELELLSKSAQLMGDVLNQVISELQPGHIEKDVAWRIETLIREGGADEAAFPPIVASGPNSALPHAVPTYRILRENEPIIFDVGARLEGYCSDMTRTIFLGDPSDIFKEIYTTVREAQILALESVKPGMESIEADSIARNHIKKAGFSTYFGHSLGHGIGLAPHENPAIGPLRSKALREGMVFTVEPGIYIPGKGGVRLEEMVFLDKDGARVLTANENFYSF